MTIKELKNNILLALYKRYKEGEMASVDLPWKRLTLLGG